MKNILNLFRTLKSDGQKIFLKEKVKKILTRYILNLKSWWIKTGE
jgi:hypothetical protein